MRINTLIKVNRLVFLSLALGAIGWVNLQVDASATSAFTQSTQSEHRGSGRCNDQCPSSQSFDGGKIARRGSGRIDSNQIG